MDIHQSIKDMGILTYVVAISLGDMYAKCGSIDKAHELFNMMPQRNALMECNDCKICTKWIFFKKALETFKQMHKKNFQANAISACKTKFHNLIQHPPCLCQNGIFGTRCRQSSKHKGYRSFWKEARCAEIASYTNLMRGELYKFNLIFTIIATWNI